MRRSRRGSARLVVLALVVLASPRRAAADDDFLTSSPGLLSKSHEALDSSEHCNDCHDGGRGLVNAKCLGCHDHGDLKDRIAAGKGFHASSAVTGQECRHCHQEHRGRKFDLMGWRAIGGEKKFDHTLAGWPLRGKHAVTSCRTCHKQSDRQGLKTYLGADKSCGGCHADDQPHGALRKALMDCERCHAETTWKPAKTTRQFDHDSTKDAAMPLVGTHADVACGKCHPQAKFKLDRKEPTACATCHTSPHDGQLFGTKKCELCHSPKYRTLSEVRFDHKKQARYALVGSHAKLECETCHTKKLGTRKPKGACETCHADDSNHRRRFDKFGDPPRCATCHPQSSWKARTFDHAQDAGFELTGKHEQKTCRDCHRGKSPADFERFDLARDGCMGCHRHKAAHGGKFAKDKCLTCHIEGGSKKMTDSSLETYHGERSRFPLRKAHAKVQCQLCHSNDTFKNTPRECGVACHEDSLHRGGLGDTCSRCHEPGDWSVPRFDHTQDTTWPLRGKHVKEATCEGCHPAQQFTGTPTSCGAAGCHQKDDVHRGALGTACQRCHDERGGIGFKHNRDATFAITGSHTLLVCANCHPSVAFKPVASECVGCHAEPEIHKGRYGVQCERCHSTASFGDIQKQHDVGDFSLTGAHDRVACARCHPGGEKRRGSGSLCINCHRQDDVHANSLSPRCGDCHGQRSFSPARFDHLSVGCNLMGLHRTLPCADCHTNGNFGAVSPLCVSCHRDDALAAVRPDHTALVECGSCHNPNTWRVATRLGRQGICR